MALDTDYGNDIDCVNDLTFAMATVSGTKMMAQAIARRVTTPRGGLFYNGEYGWDLTALVSEAEVSPAEVNGAVENEVLKDLRVDDVDVTSVFEAATKTMTVDIVGHGSEGPFALTLLVSDVTVELLREGNV